MTVPPRDQPPFHRSLAGSRAPLRTAVTLGTLLSAVSSAVLLGLIFGTFPALRASRFSPIDAIRHD